MKKTKKPVRVEIIKPAERRALRQTGRTAKVRTIAREVDAAFIRFESLRESELQIKAKAEAQFEKDFEHLKRFRKGWRTNTNLSEDEEIVRRVGLAREQREAAEDYARQTAQECARAADALENIEQAITEGNPE